MPDGTRAIAIPFYLASDELTALHAERLGHVEGRNPADMLRYLRHEMGHVVNYAYRLFDEPEWASLFGPMSQPYREEYHPIPFSRDFVRHLPGWYAQKHPDEDWAETFAVWMTPGLDWGRSTRLAGRPGKLAYCDRTMRGLANREPFATSARSSTKTSRRSRLTLDEFYAEAEKGRPVPRIRGAGFRPSQPSSTTRVVRRDRWPASGPHPPVTLRRSPPRSTAGRADSLSGPGPCSVTWRSEPMRWGSSFPRRRRIVGSHPPDGLHDRRSHVHSRIDRTDHHSR